MTQEFIWQIINSGLALIALILSSISLYNEMSSLDLDLIDKINYILPGDSLYNNLLTKNRKLTFYCEYKYLSKNKIPKKFKWKRKKTGEYSINFRNQSFIV